MTASPPAAAAAVGVNKKRRLEEEEEGGKEEQPQQKRSKKVTISTCSSLLNPLAKSLEGTNTITLRDSCGSETDAHWPPLQTIADFLVERLDGMTGQYAVRLGIALYEKSGFAKLCPACSKIDLRKSSKSAKLLAQSDVLIDILKAYFQKNFSIDQVPEKGGRLLFDLVSARLLVFVAEDEYRGDRWGENGFGLDFALVRSIGNQLKALQGFEEGNLVRWMDEKDNADEHVFEFLKSHCGACFACAYLHATYGQCGGDVDKCESDLMESISEQVLDLMAYEDKDKDECECEIESENESESE